MAGDYGKQGWRQREGWSQWGPYAGHQKGARRGGWKQQNEGWHQGPWWDKKGAPAWGGDGRASRGGGGSPWRGLREVAGAARTALDAVATVRAIVAPSATEVAPPCAEESEQRGFLATARKWLTGEASPPPPPASHGGSPPKALCDSTATDLLMGKLMGGSVATTPPKKEEPQQELARLREELASHRQLLSALVDKVADPQAAPAPAPRGAPLSGPSGRRAGDRGEARQDSGTNELLEALLVELKQARKEAAGVALGAGEEEGTHLPLSGGTRAVPAKAAFNPEGEVTPEGHAYFWSWLDDTPKAPWLMAAPFGQWVKKMSYKSSVSDVRLWVEQKALPMEDGALLSRSREELLGSLAKAAAEELPADQAASGSSRGPRQTKLGDLPGVQSVAATR